MRPIFTFVEMLEKIDMYAKSFIRFEIHTKMVIHAFSFSIQHKKCSSMNFLFELCGAGPITFAILGCFTPS